MGILEKIKEIEFEVRSGPAAGKQRAGKVQLAVVSVTACLRTVCAEPCPLACCLLLLPASADGPDAEEQGHRVSQ